MKSDKSFLEFIRSSDKTALLGVLFLVGISLILIGSMNFKSVSNDEQSRVEEVCSMVDGVGECRVMMTYREVDGEERVYGITVLCQGAESAKVRKDLTEMLSSLYGIGSNRIEILQLEKKVE